MALYAFGGQQQSYIPRGFSPFGTPDWMNLNPVQYQYYNSNPQAVIGAFNQASRRAPGASLAWRDYADKWMRQMQDEWMGNIGQNGGDDTPFWEYVRQNQQSLQQGYAMAGQQQRPFVRPTRWLRRY